jgi:hypothetical protein
MKEIIPVLMIGILILSGLGVGAQKSVTKESGSSGIDEKLDYTHPVLVEACTATFCEPCAIAAAVMNDIYESGEYNFSYVALVKDENPYANARTNELNAFIIPDYVFDGGVTRYVGSDGLPEAYTTRLDQCGARSVANITLDLQAIWIGGGKIDITLDLQNNENTPYSGHLHVYVTEIVSRWDTYLGEPYHFAMIGNYPLNTKVNTPAGEISQYKTVWDGNKYGVGDIQKDNIMVIATVFDAGTKYVDETIAAAPVEKPILYIQPLTNSLFRMKIKINNSGSLNATDLRWSIECDGKGIFLGKNTSGGPENIPINGSVTVSSNLIFGVGPTAITVRAWMPDGLSDVRKQSAFVLLFYIFLKADTTL